MCAVSGMNPNQDPGDIKEIMKDLDENKRLDVWTISYVFGDIIERGAHSQTSATHDAIALFRKYGAAARSLPSKQRVALMQFQQVLEAWAVYQERINGRVFSSQRPFESFQPVKDWVAKVSEGVQDINTLGAALEEDLKNEPDIMALLVRNSVKAALFFCSVVDPQTTPSIPLALVNLFFNTSSVKEAVTRKYKAALVYAQQRTESEVVIAIPHVELPQTLLDAITAGAIQAIEDERDKVLEDLSQKTPVWCMYNLIHN